MPLTTKTLDRECIFEEPAFIELEEIAMKDESLKAAFSGWEELSMTQEEFLAYESRLKHILDEEAAKREAELRLEAAKRESEEKIKAAKRKSEEKGRIEMKIKTAQRLLEEGMDIDLIHRVTELPIEEIKSLQKN